MYVPTRYVRVGEKMRDTVPFLVLNPGDMLLIKDVIQRTQILRQNNALFILR